MKIEIVVTETGKLQFTADAAAERVAVYANGRTKEEAAKAAVERLFGVLRTQRGAR